MSIPKKASPYLGKKGLRYKGDTYDYPLKVGKLKSFRGVFKNVILELYRRGNTYYLHFHDSKKGLIGVGKIHKLDAYYLVRNALSKKGYDGDVQLSSDQFRDMVSGLDMTFIDQ